MIKPTFSVGRWARRFGIGLSVEWDLWDITLSLDIGRHCLELRFEIPYSEERARRLEEKLAKEVRGQ
jgi:hypothetical protein